MAVPSLFHQNLSERVKQNSRMRQLSPSNRSLSSCDSPLASDSVGGSPETVDYPVGDIPCRNSRRATKSLMRKYNLVKSKLVVDKYKAIKQRRLSQKQQGMNDRFENGLHSNGSPIKVMSFTRPNSVELEISCDKNNDSITEQMHMHLMSMEKCAMETDEVTSTVFSDTEKSFSAVLFTDAHLSSAQECSPVKPMTYDAVPFTRNENLRLVINNSAADMEGVNDLVDFDTLDMPVLSPILPSSPMTFNASEELPSMISSFQDQFLQFMSSPEERKTPPSFPPPVDEQDECPRLMESYRRKRSRSSYDNSTCPCCFGANHVDKRKKSARGRRKKHSHQRGIPKLWRLNMQYQDYIDSSQRLMTLRRKLYTLFCTLFPKLQHLLDAINPDTGKLDLVIDEVIDIVQDNDDEDYLDPDEKMSVNNNSDGASATGDFLPTSPTPTIGISSDSNASAIDSEPRSKPASPVDVNHGSCSLEMQPASPDDDCISSSCLPPNLENSDTQSSSNENIDCTANQLSQSDLVLADSNANLSLKCLSSETAVSNSTLKKVTCTEESTVSSSSDSLSIASRFKSMTDSVDGMVLPSKNTTDHGCDTSKELKVLKTVECGTPSPYDMPHSEPFSCKSEQDLSCGSSQSQLFSNSLDDSCTTNLANLAKFGLKDVKITLCRSPEECLSLLRFKIGSLLHGLLPDLTFENNFDANSDDVEHLLDSVIRCNTQTSLFSLKDMLF